MRTCPGIVAVCAHGIPDGIPIGWDGDRFGREHDTREPERRVRRLNVEFADGEVVKGPGCPRNECFSSLNSFSHGLRGQALRYDGLSFYMRLHDASRIIHSMYIHIHTYVCISVLYSFPFP